MTFDPILAHENPRAWQRLHPWFRTWIRAWGMVAFAAAGELAAREHNAGRGW